MQAEKPLVLVIDDDIVIQRYLESVLPGQGFLVTVAGTGAEGIAQAASLRPAIILLDLGLPDMDGAVVTRQLREWCHTPIIILSVRQDESDKIAVLDEGADDYLVKPFSVPELAARIRAAARRAALAGSENDPIVTVREIRIDLNLRRVTRNGQEIHLTRLEFKLLAALARRAGQLVTSDKILKEVWGPEYGTETNYLRIYIKQLRDKLGDDPAQPHILRTEAGIGYRLLVD